MSLDDRIEDALGARPVRTVSLSGGCIADARRLEMPDGSKLVAKVGGSADLTIEAFMLQLLAQRSELPVPGVVHAEPDLLVMEFIEHDGRRLEDGERGAADMLVALHGVTVDAYGLERDTLIGPLVQPNAWMQSWPRFYAERRLQIMGDLAERVGSLPGGVRGRLDAVCDRIEDLVGDAAPPSLVHGDIWSGNVLWDSGRVAAFIDPAVHYADAEVELAFIALFSCFGGAFWARYSELRPIREGFFETRRTLYQLQPLLIHAALFGGGYGVQVKQAIGRLGFQHGWSG